MARKPRLHYPGAVYHVILRGNGNQQIFLDDTDRTRFLLLLQEGCEKFGHKIHAYCLMPQHLQLVIEVDEVPLSRIMQQIGFRFTRWFNDWHGQGGHLFQGRYRAILIDSERYLLDLVQHLHAVPVRAGLASEPMRYYWSSHRAYCGREVIVWLTTEKAFKPIVDFGIRALMKFHNMVNEGLQGPELVDFSRGGLVDPRVLGDEDFVREVMKKSRQKYQPKVNPEKVIKAVLDRYKLSEDEVAAPGKNRICAEARAYLSWLYLETGCATLTSLGDQLGRDVSSLSSAVRRLQMKAKKDEQVAEKYQKLLKRVRG